MKTLILTPNKNEMCGMYQLAKDLAKELKADIRTKEDKLDNLVLAKYDTVVTFLYPMHSKGKFLKELYGTRWICYDQGIPPVTKQYFPNFWRRQAMRYINWRNNITKQGADEYWNVTEREQKPRWTTKKPIEDWIDENLAKKGMSYACYIGRRTDYKNFDWLKKTCDELEIQLLCSNNNTDDEVWALLSNASLLVTASTWEGYGRSVMEASALDIPVVCFDTGVHKKLVKKGFVVENHNFNLFKEKLKEAWQIYSATQSLS